MQLPRWRNSALVPRWRLVCVLLASLALFLIAAYAAACRWEYRILAAEFERESSRVEGSLAEAFADSIRYLNILEAYRRASPRFTQHTFGQVAKPLLDGSPYLVAVGWAPRITREQRPLWDRDSTGRLGSPIEIRGRLTAKGPVRSTEKEEYFPLLYVEPQRQGAYAVGYDLSAEPQRHTALMRSRQLNKAVAIDPVPLISGGGYKQSIVVVRAALSPTGELDGMLLAAILPERLLPPVEARAGLAITLRDLGSDAAISVQEGAAPDAPPLLQHVRTLRFAERDWRLEINAYRQFYAHRRSYLPEAGLAAGVLLLIAVGVHMILTNRNVASARRLARRRNRRLRKLNIEYQEEILERKQAEVRLADYSEQLEQASLLAESSARAKSEFLAMVSHEIRTPMHAIIGMTNILLDSPLNADQRESAGIVLRSADALLQIINDILDFSKIEAGKFELDHAPFDLQQTISEVMDAVSVRAGEKGIHLMVSYPSNAPTRFLGDGGAVRQVLLNLAGNAVKFTEHGRVAVDILALEEDDDVSQMHISVSDTGIGIPEDRLHMLFHPFQQTDSSMRRRYGGTGLGLSICRRLTELMGGTISVDSRQNAGTTFELHLPLRKDHSASSSTFCSLELQDFEVLIAEPNPAISAILSKQLEGCHVLHRIARTKIDALEDLQTQNCEFRVVLIGGEQTGTWNPLELAQLIRRFGCGKIALVRIAPFAVSGERAAMEHAGFSAYLVMPVFASVLVAALAQTASALRQERTPKPILTRYSLREESAASAAVETIPVTCRVLLVEDNAVNQRIGQRQLQKLNCEVEIASNGLAAIRSWSSSHFDVVLMDCQMPDMDGFEATGEIRRREALARVPRTPIIAMTANNMDGDREQCLASGMDDFLPKPVSIQDLRARLMFALAPRLSENPIQPQASCDDKNIEVPSF